MRAFAPDDLQQAGDISAASFDFDVSEPLTGDRWRARLAHLLETDPDGCFVAERDGQVVGVAQAMVRERLWCLSLLTVRPGVQSQGIGRALIERSLQYGANAEAGLIVSSDDPRALRLYGLSGFRLLPSFEAVGSVKRHSLPGPDPRVREAGLEDLEELAPISREIRGAPHTQELRVSLQSEGTLLRFGDRGFVVTYPGHGVWLLVARDHESARALLWSALEQLGDTGRPGIRWITGAQTWAIEVLLQAGMQLRPSGALCFRGSPGALQPFLPSGAFA